MSDVSGRQFSRGRGTRFAMVPLWLVDELEPKHRANGIALYAVLVAHCDTDTGEAWPTRYRLATMIGKSVETVKRTMSALVDIGAVERLEQRTNRAGSWSSTRYLVHFDPPTVGHG